jgi:cytochrome oxidase Cu insertion factor (SCO1/SenC/PrrC family)
MKPAARLLTLSASLALWGCGGQGAPDVAAVDRASEPGTAVATMPAAGDPAPDFTLIDQDRNEVTLSDFRGKSNVVLAFYVLAFTGG